jgi:hypothetical protein
MFNLGAAVTDVGRWRYGRRVAQLPQLARWATLIAFIRRRIVSQFALPIPSWALAAPG